MWLWHPAPNHFPKLLKVLNLQSLTLTICIGPKPKYSKNKIKTKIKIPNPKSLTHRPNRCALSPLGLWFALIVEHNCVKFLHFNPETQKRTHSWDRPRSPTRGRLPQINSPVSIGFLNCRRKCAFTNFNSLSSSFCFNCCCGWIVSGILWFGFVIVWFKKWKFGLVGDFVSDFVSIWTV